MSHLALSTKQETEINSIHQLVVGATENVKEGNEDIREVTFTLSGIKVSPGAFLAPAASTKLATKTPILRSVSQGDQEQRRLPGLDPLLPGHVLFLAAFPGLVRQLTGPGAALDSAPTATLAEFRDGLKTLKI